jgi:hypothetical protein
VARAIPKILIRPQGATEWSNQECFIGLGTSSTYATLNNTTGSGWLTTSSNNGGLAGARTRPFSEWIATPTISPLNWAGVTQVIGYNNGQLTVVPTAQYQAFSGPNWEMRVVPGQCDHP